MKRVAFRIFWAYTVEALASVALYSIAYWFFGSARISLFIRDTASAWSSLTGVLFAASLTIWVAYINITATEFGGYLKHQGLQSSYSVAFIASLMSFFLSTVVLITTLGVSHDFFRNVALGVLLYAGVNVITMVRNATGLVRAYAIFRDELRKAQKATSIPNSEKEH